ncbi:pentatricopeptide repeat-containing protein At1g02370, mitochondrial-like [Nicotiana tomentosiformis]|uniref:pentatricopeptide repeat-containing protein At1g02370, mitochondrial-like n=1 Tax=Nicotiana tomentosiformis TaxID=4098 RepID=UPI00051B44A5|nr:pentatricopeptide repeat-containing protein At1g02370, mitochondrial-like [Nicotiana tomentosiformis]
MLHSLQLKSTRKMVSRATCLRLLRSTTTCRRSFSTEMEMVAETATVSTSAITQNNRRNAGRRRLSDLMNRADPLKTNFKDALNKLHNEGKPLRKVEIIDCLSHLRRSNRFDLALQLSKWMEISKITISDADRAIRIDLLAKTEGTDSAEKYFDSLQESEKTSKTYGALLWCYCRKKMLDKGLKLFEKMKELNFASTLNYNNVISLYLSNGQPEKVPPLVQEMEQRNIAADLYTYNQLMTSYVSVKDIVSVEDVLENMENNQVKLDWFTYGNLAGMYINTGDLDKANGILQKMEKLEDINDREAFHTLITLYQKTSNSSGVNRAWESLKSVVPTPSKVSYLIVLVALSKVGDLENLEKCFREWDSGCRHEIRISNVMIESYLKRNMIEEANSVYENVLKQGVEPNLRTFGAFTNYFIKNTQIDLALKYLEMGASKANPEKRCWFPVDETIKMFLAYFEDNSDPVRVKQFCEIMKKINRLDSTVYDSLLSKNYAASEVEL